MFHIASFLIIKCCLSIDNFYIHSCRIRYSKVWHNAVLDWFHGSHDGLLKLVSSGNLISLRFNTRKVLTPVPTSSVLKLLELLLSKPKVLKMKSQEPVIKYNILPYLSNEHQER